MRSALPDLDRELATLKDFQRRTVDYVFRRLYLDEPPAHRFLVADEVGLGKTLVARGLIARALHHLDRKGIERIDVVYLCSNQDIAQQNLNRLNVTERDEIALPTRLTMLPTQIRDLAKRHINFVSLTPGTSLETTKSRQGKKEERILLFRILARQPGLSRGGLRNLLQATVRRDNWVRDLGGMEMRIDRELSRRFLKALRGDQELWTRLQKAAQAFRFKTNQQRIPPELKELRYAVIGDLRRLMAGVCVKALEPDLIILDEFQRFRDLLDGESEAAELTRELLNYQESSGYRARVLLLSATPYRMLSLYEDQEDHYQDFLRTCRFLFDGDDQRTTSLERALTRYRLALFDRSDGDGPTWAPTAELEAARKEVQRTLLSVMVRTERAGGAGSRTAMLSERRRHSPVGPEDLEQAKMADRVSRAVDAYDPVEYWKSTPYLLNLMRGYQLHTKLVDQAEAPPPDLFDALRGSRDGLLRSREVEEYRHLDPANGRLRVLMEDTLEAGEWKLLWMPPSLPYLKPRGPFKSRGATTKSLVFSSWRVVPDAISSLLSYAAERRMLEEGDDASRYSRLYDSATRPLDFAIKDERPAGMNPLMLLYPSPALARLGDPLTLATANGGAALDPEAAVDRVARRLRQTLDEAGVNRNREGGTLPDQRWYRVALARLDRVRHPKLEGWVKQAGGWRSAGMDGFGAGFRDHTQQFAQGFRDDPSLGFPPDDLVRILAELALASPAVCAYRSLRRVSGIEESADRELLHGAVRVADGFRTLFNLPETVSYLQSRSGNFRYWERALHYGLDGNLQAVLDEYAHVLRESLGLVDAGPQRVVREISEAMSAALSLGTGRVHVDELRLRPRLRRIDVSTFRIRTRFALRFGHITDDRGETVARRGTVRDAFNSPFRPFVLATTSIGQEGLDFHTYCHAVYHWNLPKNPVDLEQREGRVHRYKGHAIRKNLAEVFGLGAIRGATRPGQGDEDAAWFDPWRLLFEAARASRPKEANDLVPYWVFSEGSARVERRIPLLPLSREVSQLRRLKASLAVYRMVFGQPRQEDLLEYLRETERGADAARLDRYRISLVPPDEPEGEASSVL